MNIYERNNFQLTDPVILNARRRTTPFAWDESLTLMSEIRCTQVFSRSKQYNIVNGYTFVLHDHMDNLALLSFTLNGNDREGLKQQQYLAADQGATQMQLIDFNAQMYGVIRDNGIERKTNKTIFTPRENEVLYWISMGKTYSEIAVITIMSVNTVKFHIKNVVSKLGVSNARQAIRLGIELELIKPITVR